VLAVIMLSAIIAWPGSAHAALELPLGVPGARAAHIRILHASPVIDTTDTRDVSRDIWRVTATPDADGLHGEVVVTACAPKGTALQLRVYNRRSYWFNDQLTAMTRGLSKKKSKLCSSSERLYKLRWNGTRRLATNARASSYVVRVCLSRSAASLPLDSPVCARDAVIAHLTTGYGRILTANSLAPGERAQVELFTDRRRMRIGVVPDRSATLADVAGAVQVLPGTGHLLMPFTVPATLSSGVARLAMFDPTGKVVLQLPFVVRTGQFDIAGSDVPAHTTLVVYPTYTWSAYNGFDSDRDGTPDSWYQNNNENHTVDYLPYLERVKGRAPESGANFSQPFSGWLADRQGVGYSAITDRDLGQLDDAQLARYAAIIFVGHEEYYTQAQGDALFT